MDQMLLNTGQKRFQTRAGTIKDFGEWNISPNDIGALSKETVERILQERNTDQIHQIMYVPLKNTKDLAWLIHSVRDVLKEEKDEEVALELADVLYFFVVPHYKKTIVANESVSQDVDIIFSILTKWEHPGIDELVEDMKEVLKN
ncbi:hypothetical protein [Bacillus sp. NPDC077027]|uniref:hypothetical protein n=1 Tax=Bacillus sp. NPDC077027 TaxID=3390548 RepID=UPI003D01D3F2